MSTAERVKEITEGRGVDLIVDPVGGQSVAANIAMLATFGMLVIYGMLGGLPSPDMAQTGLLSMEKSYFTV